MRVIVATGWGADISSEGAAEHGVLAVVAKPYSAHEMRRIVASIADLSVSA